MDHLFSTNFTTLDWILVAVYLSGSLGIGVFVNRYVHDVTGYLVGGRASGTSLNIATYLGTGLGLVTLMYASMDAFSNGFAYVTLALIGAAVGLYLGSTGLVVHRLRSMKLLTIPEYFECRFNRRTRVVAGGMCAVAGILNMGLFPKMGATFITYVTGLGGQAGDHETMINLITSALIVFVLAYTVLGGMISVIVTDYIQFVVLSFGMGLGVYFCLTHPDLGWENMTRAMTEHRGERMFNPVAEGGYGWTWVFYFFLVFLASGICWAPEASRILTSRSEAVTLRTFFLSSPGQFARLAIPALWAIAAFCLVSQSSELTAHFFPDGLAGKAQNAAEAMPLALGKIVPTGLLGILVAGLMAAFMSTHDSYLLCWSSVISRDIVSPLLGDRLDGRAQIRITRISVVVIGAFLLVWGVWYELPDSVWTYMAVTGTIYLSGASVALIGSIYWRRASSAGATAAFLGGSLAVAGLFCERLSEMAGVEISAHEVGIATYASCILLFVFFSLLFPDKEEAAHSQVHARFGWRRACATLILLGSLGLCNFLSLSSWTWIYVVGLASFVLLAILVMPFGARDLRMLFQTLGEEQTAPASEEDSD